MARRRLCLWRRRRARADALAEAGVLVGEIRDRLGRLHALVVATAQWTAVRRRLICPLNTASPAIDTSAPKVTTSAARGTVGKRLPLVVQLTDASGSATMSLGGRGLSCRCGVASLHMKTVLAIVALAAAALVPVAAAGSKPPATDYDRLGGARQQAMSELGLVVQRGCDPDDTRCINSAIAAETKATKRAADIARAVAKKLSAGACKGVVLEMANAYSKRVVLLRQAQRAWATRRYVAAADAYYGRTWWSPTLDGRFFHTC